MLVGGRNPIECAFGRLKARWSILTQKMDMKLEKLHVVISASFALHNFCEQHYFDENQVKIQMDLMRWNEKKSHKTISDPIFSCNAAEVVTTKSITKYFAGSSNDLFNLF